MIRLIKIVLITSLILIAIPLLIALFVAFLITLEEEYLAIDTNILTMLIKMY